MFVLHNNTNYTFRRVFPLAHKSRVTQKSLFTATLRASSTRKRYESSSTAADAQQQQQFMTIVQRFQYFPQAFQNVVRDVRIYFLIQDALSSPRNHWTTKAGPPVWVQWKQQQLRKELAWVFPLACACMLPIVGYIPSLLAFAFPRQMLTRHFWNEYELKYFESTALASRHYYSKLVCYYWWNNYSKEMERLFHTNSNQHAEMFVDLSHAQRHPPEYWKHLAQAAGSFSFFSQDDDTTWKVFIPYWKFQARLHLNQLASDDTLLLVNVSKLQDAEVQQACKLRGLSVDRHALELYLSQLLMLRKRTCESDWGLVSVLSSCSHRHRRQL